MIGCGMLLMYSRGSIFQQHSIGERGILISKYSVKCRFSYLESELILISGVPILRGFNLQNVC